MLLRQLLQTLRAITDPQPNDEFQDTQPEAPADMSACQQPVMGFTGDWDIGPCW